jgi:hypothetical protein
VEHEPIEGEFKVISEGSRPVETPAPYEPDLRERLSELAETIYQHIVLALIMAPITWVALLISRALFPTGPL